MRKTQLNRGLQRRMTYVENKDGEIDGVNARIGWLEISTTGQTDYYRGRRLEKSGGQGFGETSATSIPVRNFWVSGVKKRGKRALAESASVEIDPDAQAAYRELWAN